MRECGCFGPTIEGDEKGCRPGLNPILFWKTIYFIIYLAALGLSCGMHDFQCVMWDFFVAALGLSSCKAQAYPLQGLWDPSSLTRDWTQVPGIARQTFNQGNPRSYSWLNGKEGERSSSCLAQNSIPKVEALRPPFWCSNYTPTFDLVLCALG